MNFAIILSNKYVNKEFEACYWLRSERKLNVKTVFYENCKIKAWILDSPSNLMKS